MNIFKPLQPLLIPSFSSKGCVKYVDEDNKLISTNSNLLIQLNHNLSNTYLISSYDAYYGLMPSNPEKWPHTDYLFVDSGGYETTTSDKSGNIWNEELMWQVYDVVYKCNNFTNSILVFTTYDSYKNLSSQIQSAFILQDKFPNAIIDLLIKLNDNDAPKPSNLANSILQFADDIKKIQIIGLTEEELGRTTKERLLNLIAIKKSLDNINWNGYIHIFGGLDPSVMRLYFYAGANIFDGLSWQRMYFENCTSLSSMCYANINDTECENRFNLMRKNLSYLQNVSCKMSALEIDKLSRIKERLEYYLINYDITISQLLKELEA